VNAVTASFNMGQMTEMSQRKKNSFYLLTFTPRYTKLIL